VGSLPSQSRTDLALATASHSHSPTSPAGSAPAAGMAGELVAPTAAEVAPHRALAAAACGGCAPAAGWLVSGLERGPVAARVRRVSHEAIYRWLHAQPVSILAKELIRLRTDQAISVAHRLDFVGTGTVPDRPHPVSPYIAHARTDRVLGRWQWLGVMRHRRSTGQPIAG